MTTDTENLVLEILKRLQADMADVKDRMASVEMHLSGSSQKTDNKAR